ncbi:MAG: 50S ribosomal protein L32 [Magnetococcales bacterium]|nr:50S ribosomal protein L32 [Magnetococcales bacterium]
MAVPKKKISHSRGGQRRAHNALETKSLSSCSNCQSPRMPHRVCPKCGWYDGREVSPVEE